jgi:hypothetical protein
MEDFKNSAINNDFASTIVIGGIFGIFLTLGNAWSDFLKEAIVSLLPPTEELVLQYFIYASSASVICTIILVCIVKFDNYRKQLRLSTIKPTIFNRSYTNAKPEIREEKVTKHIIYPLRQAKKRRYKSRNDIKK